MIEMVDEPKPKQGRKPKAKRKPNLQLTEFEVKVSCCGMDRQTEDGPWMRMFEIAFCIPGQDELLPVLRLSGTTGVDLALKLLEKVYNLEPESIKAIRGTIRRRCQREHREEINALERAGEVAMEGQED